MSQLGNELHAYRFCCPVCSQPLESIAPGENHLECGLGHGYDIRRAGRSVASPELHLDPYPLLVENGSVKIAVK